MYGINYHEAKRKVLTVQKLYLIRLSCRGVKVRNQRLQMYNACKLSNLLGVSTKLLKNWYTIKTGIQQNLHSITGIFRICTSL